MTMVFKGWQKESLIEWPDKICSVVFVAGCNFRCPFCYNQDLVLHPDKLPNIDEKEILEYLIENKDFIEGVMITGGEPTILFETQEAKTTEKQKIACPSKSSKGKKGDFIFQKFINYCNSGKVIAESELINFIKKIKKIGLEVGVETNGSNPKAIEYMIKNNLVDYIAMDIKAPLEQEKYNQLVGVRVDLNKIKESIKLIMDSNIDYEFRTTVVSQLLNREDILEIVKAIRGAKRYYLQQFKPDNNLDEKLKVIKPQSKEWLKKIAELCKKYLPNIKLRL